METEEDNSEDQQEDKIEEMSWSDKTRTTRNTKTCLRMVQRKLLTDSKHYGKLSLGIWSWLTMTLKCPLHPTGRCSTPHYIPYTLLGGALHHTTSPTPCWEVLYTTLHPLHPAGRCSTPHYVPYTLLGGALHHTTSPTPCWEVLYITLRLLYQNLHFKWNRNY